jgi:hypothetical protein
MSWPLLPCPWTSDHSRPFPWVPSAGEIRKCRDGPARYRYVDQEVGIVWNCEFHPEPLARLGLKAGKLVHENLVLGPEPESEIVKRKNIVSEDSTLGPCHRLTIWSTSLPDDSGVA